MSKIALLIGVSKFGESDLKPLPSAEEDIKAMARVLQQPELGGFDQVQALANPTRGAVEEAIYTLFANRQRDDLLLFYFSGHGVRDESGRLFLGNAQHSQRWGQAGWAYGDRGICAARKYEQQPLRSPSVGV